MASGPDDPDPASWTVDRVVQEVCHKVSQFNVKDSLNLEYLEQTLRANDIDGESLLELQDSHIKDDLGIASFGQRRQLHKIIAQLRNPAREFSAVSKRAHESDTEQPSSEKKKRRLHLQELKTTPLNASTAIEVDHEDDDFDEPEVSGHWREFLARHQEVDEDTLSDEASEEDVVDSEEDASSFKSDHSAVAKVEDHLLTRQQIDSIIDAEIQKITEEWVVHRQLKRYKKAKLHWSRAEKAGTRRPMQHAFNRELNLLQNRLQRFRAQIHDIKPTNIKEVTDACTNLEATIEDMAEQRYYLAVLNDSNPPRPQVKDKLLAAKTLRPNAPALDPDDILIESSDDNSVTDVASASDVPEVDTESMSAESLSLDYDLADDDWHPLRESEAVDHSDITAQDFDFLRPPVSGDLTTADTQIFASDEVQKAVPPQTTNEMEEAYSPAGGVPEALGQEASDDMRDFDYHGPQMDDMPPDGPESPLRLPQGPTSPLPAWAPEALQTPRRGPLAMSPQSYLDSHSYVSSSESTYDVTPPPLPQSRYRTSGFSVTDAIELGSSPASTHRSADDSDTSIRTPPLNPSSPPRNESTPSYSRLHSSTAMMNEPPSVSQMLVIPEFWKATPSSLDRAQERPVKAVSAGATGSRSWQVPSIAEIKATRWNQIKDDRQALAKVIYSFAKDDLDIVVDYISWLAQTRQNLASKLLHGIAALFDPELDPAHFVIPVEQMEGFQRYAYIFVCYMCRRTYKGSYDNIPNGDLDKAYGSVEASHWQYHQYLLPVIQHYVRNGSHKPSDTAAVTEDYSDESESAADTGGSSSRHQRTVSNQQTHAMKSMHKDDRKRVDDVEERRRLLMEKFQARAVNSTVREVPVNTSEPVVLLDAHIAQRVKEHQIKGIQFLWRELVDDTKHQGCLLAHTMGLGKTMQVISLLVTVAQCSQHSAEEYRVLIPKHLREGRTLVLCPASLIENWFDELLMWSPEPQLLGKVYKIGKQRSEKIQNVLEWHKTAGVLISSYESFRSLVYWADRNIADGGAEVRKALMDDTGLVVADEAHRLKNPTSAIARTANAIKTNSRIALTGSPLNNHLEEYHTMINWVAPGYLGTSKHFRQYYSDPINRGLYMDSSKHERRQSVQRLTVLKRDLAPKINRADISAIANEMPQKTEFFLTLPLTPPQREMYVLIIEHVRRQVSFLRDNDGRIPNQARSINAELWKWLSILSWLCNHPSILVKKLAEKGEADVQLGKVMARAPSPDDEDIHDSMPENMDLRDSSLTSVLPALENILNTAATTTCVKAEDPTLSARAEVTRHLIALAAAKGDKTLLFSHSIPTLNYLESMIQEIGFKYMRIDGSTQTDKRQAATKAFNKIESDYMVFLISTRAGGLGLNLYGANRVIIYDFGFNPSWEEQAIGRSYRFGQQKPVFVYRFKAGGTFEDSLHNNTIFKTQLFSRVVDQRNVVRHASKKVEEYLHMPTEVSKEQFETECFNKDSVLDQLLKSHPDSVRNIVLTETFQREDLEDELTAEEKKQVDEQVELRQLQRTNLPAYHQKMEEKRRSEAQRVARLNNPNPFESSLMQHPRMVMPSLIVGDDNYPRLVHRPSQQALTQLNGTSSYQDANRSKGRGEPGHCGTQ